MDTRLKYPEPMNWSGTIDRLCGRRFTPARGCSFLTAHLETEEVLYLAFTPEQAQLLKQELEKVIPVAKRRDA